MSADTIIEQIRQLPGEDQDRVANAWTELRAERENARLTAERISELRKSGSRHEATNRAGVDQEIDHSFAPSASTFFHSRNRTEPRRPEDTKLKTKDGRGLSRSERLHLPGEWSFRA